MYHVDKMPAQRLSRHDYGVKPNLYWKAMSQNELANKCRRAVHFRIASPGTSSFGGSRSSSESSGSPDMTCSRIQFGTRKASTQKTSCVNDGGLQEVCSR